MLCEKTKPRLFLTTPDGCDPGLGREFDAQVVCRRNDFHCVQPWGSHDHIIDGGMIEHREVDDLGNFLGMTGSWIDPRVIDVSPEKLVNGFGVGVISLSSMFILLRVSRKITLTVLPVSMRTLGTSRSGTTRSTTSGSQWG